MVADSKPSPVLLRLEDVVALRDERDALGDEIEGLKARFEALDRKIHAAALFMRPDDAARILGVLPEVKKPEVAIKWVVRAIREEGRGMTLPDLVRRAIAEDVIFTDGDPAVAVTDGAARAHRKGHVKKRGEVYYTNDLLARLEAAGGMAPRLRRESGASGADIRSAIIEALKQANKALVAGEIIDHIRRDPEVATALQRNPQHPYTVLSRLAKRGELERVGNMYRLPNKDVSEGGVAGGEGGVV